MKTQHWTIHGKGTYRVISSYIAVRSRRRGMRSWPFCPNATIDKSP
jgi:hypothetical protein